MADVVGRHESLRTMFAAPEGVPQQLVVPAEQADFGWEVVDATGWSEAQLDEAIDAVARHAFDLAAEIPMRARLFRVSRRRTRGGVRGAPHRRRRLVDRPAGARPGHGLRQPVRGASRRSGPNCRCSTSITRCGSARSSATSTTGTA